MSETNEQNEHATNEHLWFREHLAAALAGGLDAGERMRFESHAIKCESCAAELTAHEEMERKMTQMFAQPVAGLEDRIIGALRTAPLRWRPNLRIHPAIRRAALGVAAVIAVAVTGYAVNHDLEERETVGAGQALLHKSGNGRLVLYGDDVAKPRQYYWDFDGDITERERRADKTPASSFGRTNTRFAGEAVKSIEELQQDQKKANTNWHATINGGSARGTLNLSAINGTIEPGLTAGKPVAGQSSDGRYFKPEQLDQDFTIVDGTKSIEQIRGGVTVVEGKNTYGLEVKDAAVPAAPVVLGAVPQLVAQAGQEILPPPANKPADAANHKIIRTGQMEFEVDRYDAAFAQVSKLTTEAGGYLGTTDSEKLPNGKVKGTITLRVPPERLDTLVLQLRGIGDLKSQKLDANDITKQYNDLESELKAARAMEERLLGIIKEGKGQIKDLLAAEKELGVWRTKIEKITGEMRFFDNQVTLSTLTVSLFERDIKTPATAQQTETIDTGIESADVEKARGEALKAIEDAKGRVIQSELKRYDAGQFGATIIAEVPPDASGPLLDRLKQIGKVARLDIQRKQTSDPNANASAPVRVENKPTRLNLSLYNLANVAPRVSSQLTLAADDVEVTYRSIVERINKVGRVVGSNLAKNKPDQTTGAISFEVPAESADALLSELRTLGDVVTLTTNENPDVQNSTAAKQGFSLSIIATATIPPREATGLTVETTKVDFAVADLQQSIGAAGGRVIESNLSKDRDGRTIAKLAFEVPLDKSVALLEQAKKQGIVRAIQSNRNLEVPAGPRAKARVDLQLVTPDTLVEAGTGPLATIRAGLAKSVKGLLWSLELVVIGVCFVLPFVLVLWGAWKLIKRTPKLRRDVGAGAAG